MATSILITCPDCNKQLKGPAELEGKRVRCKSCRHTFTVRAAAAPAESTPSSRAAAKSPAPAPAPASRAKKDRREDDAGKNPYRLSDILPTHRCPQCAAEIEEDAIICVNCGYNNQTRMRHHTIKTYETTAGDRLVWWAPGIVCAIVFLLVLGVIGFIWLPVGLPRLAGTGESKAWWGHFSIQIYGTVFVGFIGWQAAKFAFRRLILHPSPPERIRV